MTQRKIQSVQLSDSGVVPGPYTNANVTVDSAGRITVIANGSSGTPALTSTQVAYGSLSNLITSTADFTYDDTTGTLEVGPTGSPALVTANTGQSITVEGDTGAQLKSGVNTFGINSSGAVLANASAGTVGQVLTSAGSGAPVTWAAGGGGASFPLSRSELVADSLTNTEIAWTNGTLNDDGSSRIRGVNDDSFLNKVIMVCEGYDSGSWATGWMMYPEVDACFTSHMAVEIPYLVTSNIVGLDLVNSAVAANGLAINGDPYNYQSGNITIGVQYPKIQITSVVGPFSTVQTAIGGGFTVIPAFQNVYKITAYGICTGVSGQTTTIYIRYGASGVVGDTAILTAVCNNGTGTNIPFRFEAIITVYASGSMRVTASVMNSGITGISNQSNVIFSPVSTAGLPGSGQIKLWAVSSNAGSTTSWYNSVIESIR